LRWRFAKNASRCVQEAGSSGGSNLLLCFINPQPTCDALAALFSCRPNRPGLFCRAHHRRCFPTLLKSIPPFAAIRNSAQSESSERVCGSSAYQSLSEASVNGCRTVTIPLESLLSANGNDDNWTEVRAPSTASFGQLDDVQFHFRSAKAVALRAIVFLQRQTAKPTQRPGQW